MVEGKRPSIAKDWSPHESIKTRINSFESIRDIWIIGRRLPNGELKFSFTYVHIFIQMR